MKPDTIRTDGKAFNLGASRFAYELRTAVNSSAANTILVSAGDNYQGSAMSNLKYGEPVSKMFKSLGVTASAVGNHEFDWGVDYIGQWAQDGGFDFLASNIYSKTTGKPVTWAQPYKIVEKNGLKIGLIGIATPETAIKTKPENVKNIEFRDPISAANEWAAKLKSGSLPEGKADVVVALTHLGSFQDATTKAVTGEGADFAKGVVNVDAVITAHTHQTVNGVVNNIPVVQAYYNGRALAKINVGYNVEGKVIAKSSVDALYKKTSFSDDTAVKAIYDEYDKALAPILNEVVGSTDKDLTHDKDKAGVSLLGQWTSDVMKAKAGTEIGITNGGGLRIPLVAKGDITMGKMYELMPFDNTLVKMELKGSDLKRALENGIGNTSIGWVQFSGVKAYYDISRAFGDRILGLYLMDGSKVEADKYYSVVTNDFMATGGDGYNFTGAKNVFDTGIPIREALVESLRALKAEGKELAVTPVDYAIAGLPPVPVANETAKVIDAINATSTGSTLKVDIATTSTVSKDVFNAIKGLDKNVEFVRDGVTWKFNGKDLTSDATADIDLSLETVSSDLKAKETAKIKAVVGKDVSIVPFSFKYDGPLPGNVSVKVFIGTEWANKVVYINRYYADKNTYETIAEGTVDASGYVTFTTNHCSDYFIMEKSVAPSLPKTGSPVDMGVLVNFGMVVAMLGVAMIFADRRKRRSNAA